MSSSGGDSALVPMVTTVQARLLKDLRRRYVPDPRDPRVDTVWVLLQATTARMDQSELEALLIAYSVTPSAQTSWLDLQVQLECIVPHLLRRLRVPASALVDPAELASILGPRVAADGVAVCASILNVVRALGDVTWLLLLPGGPAALFKLAHDPAALLGMAVAVSWVGLDGRLVLLVPLGRIFGPRVASIPPDRLQPLMAELSLRQNNAMVQ